MLNDLALTAGQIDVLRYCRTQERAVTFAELEMEFEVTRDQLGRMVRREYLKRIDYLVGTSKRGRVKWEITAIGRMALEDNGFA